MILSDGLVPRRLALDVGTGITRLASADVPLLVEGPSALDAVTETDGALAVERGVQCPVERGVVVDIDAAARMLAPYIRAGRGDSPLKPLVLACHPSDASAEERERLVAAVLLAGAGGVRLAPEPVAAVLGNAGAQTTAAQPRLVVDLGEGVTDVAVVRDGHLLATAAVRVGLGEMRRQVYEAVLEAHDVPLLPEETSLLLTQETDGSGWLPVARTPRRRARARPGGRRLLRHLVLVNGTVLARALETQVETIGRSVSGLLGALDAKERDAVAVDGVLVVGGGALVPYLWRGIARRLGVDVDVARDPLHAVIAGARRLLRSCREVEWPGRVGTPPPRPEQCQQ